MSQSGSTYADTRSKYTAHVMFRREFGLLPDLVQSVAHEDEERAKLIADHIKLLSTLLRHHRQAEDEVLWPLLLVRAPKKTDLVIRLVEGDHQRIDTLLSGVETRLAAWANGAASDHGNALALALRELAVVLFEHMSLEEQLVLPLVERHVFDCEWQAMEGRAVVALDPQDAALLFGMVLYEGDEDIVPEALRAEFLPAATGAYADYAERLYGTRTPPSAEEVVFGAPSVGVAARAGQR
jgi:hemerythrin-like domain-containing protein